MILLCISARSAPMPCSSGRRRHRVDEAWPGVARLQLRSAADDIRSFKVMTSGLSVLYDNVRFVPEPSAAMGILCLASLSLAGGRARR